MLLRFGSNDLINPNTIIGNVITFGIMKCSKSIKNIMIKARLKINKKSVVKVKPYKT